MVTVLLMQAIIENACHVHQKIQFYQYHTSNFTTHPYYQEGTFSHSGFMTFDHLL